MKKAERRSQSRVRRKYVDTHKDASDVTPVIIISGTPWEFLLASAGAFYVSNIGRVLRGSDGGVADRYWPITIFCQW